MQQIQPTEKMKLFRITIRSFHHLRIHIKHSNQLPISNLTLTTRRDETPVSSTNSTNRKTKLFRITIPSCYYPRNRTSNTQINSQFQILPSAIENESLWAWDTSKRANQSLNFKSCIPYFLPQQITS